MLPSDNKVFQAIETLLRYIGEDPNRPGLQDTPVRVAKAWKEMCIGYGQNPAALMKVFAQEGVEYDQMVIVRDIPFESTCEHHLLPFVGKAHVAYLPNKTIIGLSKIPRLLDVFAKRLQVQERLTEEVANALMNGLNPKGVGVSIEASHSCVACRGVKKHSVTMVTSSLKGAFKEDAKTRAEFYQLIKGG